MYLNTTAKLLENIFWASVEIVCAETANEWWWNVVTDAVTEDKLVAMATGGERAAKRLLDHILDVRDCRVDFERLCDCHADES